MGGREGRGKHTASLVASNGTGFHTVVGTCCVQNGSKMIHSPKFLLVQVPVLKRAKRIKINKKLKFHHKRLKDNRHFKNFVEKWN